MGAEIFQGFLQAPKSVMDYENEYADNQTRRQGNALRAMAMQQQVDQRNRATAQQNALMQVAGSLKPGATMQEQADAYSANPLTIEHANALRDQYLKQQKGEAEAAKLQAETEAKQAETRWTLADRHTRDLAMVQTPQDAVAHIDEGIRMGVLPMRAREPLIKKIGEMGLDAWKNASLQSAIPVLDKFKTDAENARAKLSSDTSIRTTQMNNDTSVRTTGMTNATSRANNSATIGAENERARLTREQGKLQYDADRGVVVNLGTGAATEARGPGGVPLGAKDKGLNDSQAKALLFGTRMQESDKTMADLAEKGTDRPGWLKRTTEATLGVLPDWAGGKGLADAGGAATNWTQSAEQQKVEQAQRDFINAVLRRESGAAISPGEFASAQKQYFPMVGDSAQVISQKARNRALATQGMLAEVPQNKRNLAPAADPSLPPAVAAALAKHGAK